MNSKQKLLLGLLLLGLVFSSIFRLRFNLSDGFIFQNIWLKLLPVPIVSFAKQSGDLWLTTTIVGYLFFAITGVLFIWEVKSDKLLTAVLSGFLVVIVFAMAVEWLSFMQDIHDHFSGQHIWIGPALFAVGLFMLARDNRTKKLNQVA